MLKEAVRSWEVAVSNLRSVALVGMSYVGFWGLQDSGKFTCWPSESLVSCLIKVLNTD